MEIVGGFMVMMSIISLFLAVVWLIMPFVVFAIKGKQDRTLELLEAVEKRLAVIEARLQPVDPEPIRPGSVGSGDQSGAPSNEHPIENPVILDESAADSKNPDASPAV